MKSVARLGFLVLLFCVVQTSQASRFWVSAISSNWNNTVNWSTVSGGVGGASIPSINDDVVFDNNGTGNCSFDVAISIRSLTESASYTGTLSQGTYTITTSQAGNFLGGSFSGNIGNIIIGGAFTLNGSNFSSTNGVLELDNPIAAFASNTFSHNNGTVRLNAAGAQTVSGISPVFYVLEIVGKGNTISFTSAGNITILTALNTSGSLFYNINTGIFDVKGNITSSNTSTGCGGDAVININGNTPQIFTGSSIAGTGALPQININTTGGLTLINFPAVSNNLTYTAGIISAGSSTFCFTHGSAGAYTITATLNLNNISFSVNTSLLTVTIVGTLTANGNVAITGAGNLVLNTGTINVNGNITLTNTATNGGGSATINIIGTANQDLDGSAVIINQSRLPLIIVNKSGGILNLLGNISASANVTYISGTVNAGTSTCYVVNNLTVTGNMNFYNVTISASTNITLTVASGTILSVSNTFDMENAGNYIIINGGMISVQGNIVNNNTNTNGGGSGTILINGVAAQSISSTGLIDQGKLPGVSINKPSGTLTLPSLITVKGDWSYIAGNLDVSTNNSTVVFENTMSISGTHSLNNIIFNGVSNYTFTTASGTTLTIAGNIGTLGSGNITLNSGAINLMGNLSLANTGGGGGTTVLSFIGPFNQNITSSLSINQNCLPSVTINKASGILTFPAVLTVRGNWQYSNGTLDVATNNSTIVFADPLGTGLFGMTGSHTLNNVTFEATNNNTLTVATGTILTVVGALTTMGAANMYVNTPVAGAVAVQAQGDLIINNSGSLGGGSGLILINGATAQLFTSTVAGGKGLMPNITIQKTSGILTMSGIISESRNWTYSSGVVDANSNLSTVVFGGTNLSIASAGMNFYHVIFSSNTASLINQMTVTGNLTINGSGTLLPGTNTISLAGNWTNRATAGFTESTSTVIFNGFGNQVISTPGGENFANLTIDNSSAGIQLLNNVIVANNLNMSMGNVDLNGNNFTLGLSTANNGTLSRMSGNIINTGNFVRWYKAAIVPDGSVSGLFPMGNATDYRPLYITTPVISPSAGGTVSVAYFDAATNSNVSIPDPPFTIVVRKDLNWMVSTVGLTGGNYNLQVQGTGYGLIGAVSDLRLTLVNSVVGTAGVNGGTINNPQVNRTGLTLTNLSNNFYLGSINSSSSPLPVTLVYFSARLDVSGKVNLEWKTASETRNDFFTVERSMNGAVWDSLIRISSEGNTNLSTLYETKDAHPLNGKSFYRLKNTDIDGHFYLSEIQMIRNDLSDVTFLIFPNPTSKMLTVTTGSLKSFAVFLLNASGQIIRYTSADSAGKTLDVSILPPGIYYVKIISGNSIQTRPISVVR